MKVSVIIPVYNVEQYLSDCLNSVINQTLKDIEVIAVNDGSTDGSLDILNRYSYKYSFIKVISQPNKGQGMARNIGLKKSNGEYIYFLDGDDYVDKSTLEECYIQAKKNKLDIITFDANVFKDNNFDFECNLFNYNRKNILNTDIMKGEDFYNYSLNKGAYRSSVCLCFYKKKLLLDNYVEFPEKMIHEDELFNVKMFINADSVKYIPKDFLFRRLRPNSTMTKKTSGKNVKGYLFTAEELYEFYIENKRYLKKYTFITLKKHINVFYYMSIVKFNEAYKSKMIKNKKIKNQILKSYLKSFYILELKTLIKILLKYL